MPARPVALSPGFAMIEGKDIQWKAFVRRYGLPDEDFVGVIRQVSSFLKPIVAAIVENKSFTNTSASGGPWK